MSTVTTKKSEVKRHVRKLLSRWSPSLVELGRPDECSFEIKVKDHSMGQLYVLDEFNDEGDPCVTADHDEIYEAINAIVDEHNQNLT